MKQTIFAVVLAIILGITSGFPVFTCDKLKDVEEGVDNHGQYLVKLKDINSYVDAKNLIDLVKQYQTTLELYASNVDEPSVKSELELSENSAGVLYGTLSQQALYLVCITSSVEYITPDYPKPVVLPEGSGESDSTIDCPKLNLDESHTGNDYSIAFKPKTSSANLFYIITKMELANQNDDALSFKYRYSVRKGKQFFMLVRMNIKALEMVCKETRVQEITSNHDTSSINKRDATEQDTTTSGPCDLPEHKDEFPNFIFTYKSGVDLDAIKNSVEQLTENSAQVKSTTVLHFLDMIIFQMNREAYLQACTNSELMSVEYEKFIAPIGHCSLPERDEEFSRYIFVYNRGADIEAIKQSVEEYSGNSAEVQSAEALESFDMIFFDMNRAAYLQACTNTEIKSVEYDGETTTAEQQKTTNTDICAQIDSLSDSSDTYTAVLRKPDTVEEKQSRCLKLIQKLKTQTAKSDGTFWYYANSESCTTSGTEVTLTVRLNLEALKYTCELKGLDISLVKPPPCTSDICL